MTTNIGTLFPVTIAAGSDTADVDAAFKYYHWGQTTELAGSSMTTSGGGITGALYRLTNNPKFYGNSTAPYLTVYSGTPGVNGTTVLTINGSTNSLVGAFSLSSTLTVTGLITATAGVKGSLYSAASSAITIDTSATDALFTGNIKATSQNNGKVTLVNTDTASASTAYTVKGRIFVQATAPSATAGTVAQDGDLWFW
jgi:hypothetical protein